MQERKSPRTGCASRTCFGMQLPTPLGTGMSKVIPSVVLGSRSQLGSDRLAQTGLAVADADVPSVPCLVLHPAVPALPAFSETCARHSQDLSMAPNSCFPFLTPPKSAGLTDSREGSRGAEFLQSWWKSSLMQGTPPNHCLPSKISLLLLYEAGISSRWQEEGGSLLQVGTTGSCPQSLDEGLQQRFPCDHTLCLCLRR